MEDRQYYEAHQEQKSIAVDPKERHTAAMGANSHMIGGNHYKHGDAVGQCPHCRKEIEHWDWGFNLRGLEYAITKYIARWREKGNPLDNLKKVLHYTQKLIEIHFPGVRVTVNITNMDEQGGAAQAEPIAAQSTLGGTGCWPRPETGIGPTVDAEESSDSSICDARDVEGAKCFLMRGHLGPHERLGGRFTFTE